MQRKEIEKIIAKYEKLSASTYPHDEKKAHRYEHIARFIEENIDLFEEGDYESEDDLLDDYNEVEADMEFQRKNMFPEDDD